VNAHPRFVAACSGRVAALSAVTSPATSTASSRRGSPSAGRTRSPAPVSDTSRAAGRGGHGRTRTAARPRSALSVLAGFRLADPIGQRLEQRPGHLRVALDERPEAPDRQLVAVDVVLRTGPNHMIAESRAFICTRDATPLRRRQMRQLCCRRRLLRLQSRTDRSGAERDRASSDPRLRLPVGLTRP
jgi:hypothetical protein